MLDTKRVDQITRKLFGIAEKKRPERTARLLRLPKDRRLREALRDMMELRHGRR